MDGRNEIERSKSESLTHIPWVAGRPDGYYFIAEPLDINAPVQTVWDLVKCVDEYNNFSNGAVTVSLPQGELKENNTIRFVMYPNDVIGWFIPASNERISVLDNHNYVLAWERNAPLGGMTECYRVLEPLDDGAKTRSYVALKIPGFAGFFTHHLMKKKIEEAFNRINRGIKDEAERRETECTRPGCG